jgi:hypothetical protein
MKKQLLLILSFTIIFIVLLADINTTGANSASPPVARAGAPMDNSGLTCAASGCHSGTAVTQTTGVIINDIPVSGFIGGTTYNFSVTMSGSSAYGFELTPQTATSNVGLGTWIAGVGSNISTKYIRQSAKGTGTSKTWTFKWTAPATATTVTFYGAFNYANNNGSTTGDVIKTSSITVMANTTGVEELASEKTVVSVFPNPTTEALHIASVEAFTSGGIYTLDGKLVKVMAEQELLEKTISVNDLEKGMYFIRLISKNKPFSTKFFKN